MQGASRLRGVKLDAFVARGSVAEVYRGQLVTGERIVIKTLRREFACDRAYITLLLEEGELLLRLAHTNICRCLDVIANPPALVLEDQGGATLAELLCGPWAKGVPLAEALFITHELTRALCYLHERDIAHLGILPSNVMLSHTGHAVLIDFGHGSWPGRKTIIKREPKDPTAKNAGYACPEASSSAPFGKPADLYRLGALLAHMLTGEPPKHEPLAQAMPSAPPAVLALQAALTAHDPASRPTADLALVQEIAKLREACRQNP